MTVRHPARRGSVRRTRQTDAERAANVTPTDYSYLPGDIRRYGAAVGTADNTTAIQSAINVAAHAGIGVYVPGNNGSRWRFASTVYCYYDASNNPNFPSGARQDGRLIIYGDACPDRLNFVNTEYRGSILEYTGATGIGLDGYDSSGSEAMAIVLRDVGVYANTTGYAVQLDRVPTLSELTNVFVGNNGDGGCLKIDTWSSVLTNVWLYGNGSGSACKLDTSDGGGNVIWTNVNFENCDIGLDMGAAYDAGRGESAFFDNHIFIGCQARVNRIGYRLRAGVGGATFIDCWSELHTGATGRAVQMSDMCGWQDGYANRGLIKFIGGFYADAATDAGFIHFEIGDDTGTDTTDGVGNVLMLGVKLGQIGANTIGIRIHNSANAGYRDIQNLVAHNNGGIICAVDDEAQYGTIYASKWDGDNLNQNNWIENTSSADRSWWALTDWSPTLAGTASYDYSNAKRLPSLHIAQNGGDITIVLPTSPEEHTALIHVATNNVQELVIDPGTNDLNGSTSDITFDGKYATLFLSWDVAQEWTLSVAPAPNSSAYTLNATAVLDRTLLASASATATNNNNVLAALITDLKDKGILT